MPMDSRQKTHAEERARPPIPSSNQEPKTVAAVMALVEAEYWKLRARMLIYHRETVAELDRLYEILYGTPPARRKGTGRRSRRT